MGVEGTFTTTIVNGDGTPIDPLTVEWWQDLQEWPWGCDCPAGECEAMMHREDCWVTPIYAQLVNELGGPRDIAADVWGANFGVVYHAIKCAVCGQSIPAKDALVVYECRESGPVKQLKNMRYAVCPEHNREGVISYQRSMPSGC